MVSDPSAETVIDAWNLLSSSPTLYEKEGKRIEALSAGSPITKEERKGVSWVNNPGSWNRRRYSADRLCDDHLE